MDRLPDSGNHKPVKADHPVQDGQGAGALECFGDRPLPGAAQAKPTTPPKTPPGKNNKVGKVKIGTKGFVKDPVYETLSWADLAADNAGIRYLIDGWTPYAMLTGVVGQPKAGKSAFLLGAVVGPIVTGRSFFTGQAVAEPGYVVWVDTERRLALNMDRARKWGLDVNRIQTPFADRKETFSLDRPDHIQQLSDVVNQYEPEAVILDSYRGAHSGDENNSRISTGLLAFAGVCEETGTAGLVVHHTRKMRFDEDIDMNSGRGSGAFLASVVCQIAIDIPDPAPGPRDATRRVQLLGENLGVAPQPFGFRITETGLVFGPAPSRPAKEQKETGKDRAVAWLKTRMKPGREYLSADIVAEAEAAGFSATGTLQRAREELGVLIRKDGQTKHTFWRVPADRVRN
jgi:hypothetical protein